MKHLHRGGYVLLVTLALLVMASTLLMTIARSAVGRSLDAIQAQDQLQRKWAVLSCRSAVLPGAEAILAGVEASADRAAPKATFTVRLGEQQIDLIIGDEQAKANLNALLEHQTVGQTEDRLRSELTGSGLVNAIRLRPIFDPSSDEPADLVPRQIRSFGQVTTETAPGLLAGVSAPSPIAALTCWGNGAVNVLRADEPALRLALWPTLSRIQIGRLVSARQKLISISRTGHAAQLDGAVPPTNSINYLISQAEIDAKTASRLTMTDRSACHSLWIIVKDRQRVWYNLAVADDSMPQHPRHVFFTW